MRRSGILLILVSMALTACGTTPTERGLSGAGIGASAGAVLGAVTGLSVLQGVVIGAAAGGLTGALTDKSQINLGNPIWKRGSGSQAAVPAGSSAPSNAQTVRGVQSGLARLGFDPGPADGVAGAKTRAAIRNYQHYYGLPVDGRPSQELAAHIQNQLGGS